MTGPTWEPIRQLDRPSWLPGDDAIEEHFRGSAFFLSYRVRLAAALAGCLPVDGELEILDIGAGDGLMSGLFARHRPGTTVRGLDVLLQPKRDPAVDVTRYDGLTVPMADGSVDVCLLCNVLHHAADPARLFLEAVRVSRRQVIIKDHMCWNRRTRLQLTLLDVMGNVRFGIETTGRYMDHGQWETLFAWSGLAGVRYRAGLELRRGVMAWLFSNRLEILFVIEARPRPGVASD